MNDRNKYESKEYDQEEYEQFNMSSGESGEAQEDVDGFPVDEDDALEGSPWDKASTGSVISQYIRQNGALLVGVGIGIAVLFLLFKLLPTTQMSPDKKTIMALEARISQLEESVSQIMGEGPIDPSPEGDGSAQPYAEVAEGMAVLSSRMEKIEALVGSRIDEFADKLDTLEKTKSRATQTTTQQKKNVASQAAGTTTKYHTISPGDTLYSIANRYKISLDILRKINGLPENAVIKSGQRLKITP